MTWRARMPHRPGEVKADRTIHRQTGAKADYMIRHRTKGRTVRVRRSFGHTMEMDGYKIRRRNLRTVYCTNPRRNLLHCSPDTKARSVGWNSFRDLAPMRIRAALLHPMDAGRWLRLLARSAHSSAEPASSAELKAARNSGYRRPAKRRVGLDPRHPQTDAAHCCVSSFAAPTVSNSWVAN